jgi:hypothetical protein
LGSGAGFGTAGEGSVRHDEPDTKLSTVQRKRKSVDSFSPVWIGQGEVGFAVRPQPPQFDACRKVNFLRAAQRIQIFGYGRMGVLTHEDLVFRQRAARLPAQSDAPRLACPGFGRRLRRARLVWAEGPLGLEAPPLNNIHYLAIASSTSHLCNVHLSIT